MNIAIILSSGIGERFRATIPKQYTLLNGKKTIEYVLEAIVAAKKIDKIILVAEPQKEYCKHLSKTYGTDLTCGGSTRNESLMNGLEHIKQNYPKCDKVMIFDAVRPLIPHNLFDIYMDKLEEYDVVITCKKIIDEIGCYHDFDLCRDDYFLMSSPQAYKISWLYEHFQKGSTKTEVFYQMPRNIKPYFYFGFENNFKLTYPWDKIIIEEMLKKN